MDEYRMVEGKDVTGFLSALAMLIARSVHYVLSSIRQYIIAVIIVFLLVVGSGTFFWYNTRPLYESEMVCEFNKLSKKTYGEMVQKLNLLAKSHSYTALAGNLHIPLNDAKKIVSIDGRNAEGSLLAEDAKPDRDPMYFKITATDNSIYPLMQSALVTYMNNNSPYRLHMNELELDRTTKKLDFMRSDMAIVDSILIGFSVSLKSANYRSDTSSRMATIPALLNYKKQLEDDYLGLEWGKKELNASVEVLYGFTPADFAARGKNKILIKTLFLALLLPVFTALLLRLSKEGSNYRTS